MTVDELVGQDVLHVACVEKGVVERIVLRVDFSIFNGFWHIFNTNNLFGLFGYEAGYGSCTCVEIVYQLVASQVGQAAGYFVKLVCRSGRTT